MKEIDLIERQLDSKLIFDGRILHVYDDTVSLPNGHTASRELIRHVGAVCVLPLTDDGNVIVERQYRYPVGRVLTEIPAGKLDSKQEDHEYAARRELREETGLRIVRIDDVLDGSYSAIGFSNERNICVFGVAEGEFTRSTSDAEEIVPGWYTKEEMRALLRTEAFAARTMAYCYAWAYGGVPAGAGGAGK